MPTSLHEELARASDRDGVSLNQFITGVLASAVGWRREDGTEIAPGGEQKLRSRRMAMLLVANLVLVGLAAIAAIAFLIAAWLS
jgi:HicB-like protein involved in pilus formation